MYFITASKLSLGQGNIFTGVYLSMGGVPSWVDTPLVRHPSEQIHPLRTDTLPGQTTPGRDTPPETATEAGGTHPTGMHSCLLKVSMSLPLVRHQCRFFLAASRLKGKEIKGFREDYM